MSSRRLIAGCAPQLLVALDFAYVGVAAPSVRAALNLSDPALQWVFSTYSLSFGCLLLASGRAADAFGRRRMLLTGQALFACATAANAAAPSGAALLASRAVQGAGAALMTPAALSLLTAGAAEGAERNRTLAAYGMTISAGFVAGSLLAGALATAASWRLVLALNVPLVLAALAVTRGVREPARDVSERPRPRALSRMPGIRPACVAGLVITGTGVSGVLLLTLYLQELRGYTPLTAGVALALFGVTAPAGGALARRTAQRAGPGTALVVGLGVQGASLLSLVLAPGGGAIVPALVAIAGFGLGHVVGNAAVALAAVSHAPPATHGTVAGLLATAQYLGGALVPAAIIGVAGGSELAGFHAGTAVAGGLCLVAAAALSRAPTRCPARST
jgi:MFS family permease